MPSCLERTARGSVSRDLLWMAAGAAILLAIVLLVMRVAGGRSPAEQLVLHAEKLEIADAMSVALASAAEAEKSAVLAVTDDDARAFADQARTATRTVEEHRGSLEQLLHTDGTADERDRLGQFGRVFLDFQRVDDELLALAVTNTNLKAYAMTYGPAAQTLNAMEAALSDLLTADASSPDLGAITVLALGAEVAAFHVQTLLPPHIAEETEEKMATLEAEMAREVQTVERDLDSLAAIPSVGKAPDLRKAAVDWRQYRELETTILALSHENSDVLSLGLSLRRKRELTEACQRALRDLHDAIKAEPIAGMAKFRPVSPR